PITDIWKEIRHDYLEETSGCACLGARRDCASIAKLRARSAGTHRAHCQQSDLWRLRLGTKLPLLWWLTPLGRGLPVQAHAMARLGGRPVPAASRKIVRLWVSTSALTRESMLNIARMAWFSSDREYAQNIWKVPFELPPNREQEQTS